MKGTIMNVRLRLRAAILALFACALVPAAPAAARVRVAASVTDLASIAASVGGDQVEVFAIARPNADVHRVEVLPSYMVRVSRADLYLKVGLGLDPWADGIIDGSRNPKLRVADCSAGIEVLDRPTVRASELARLGDVHPQGNPHYWLDPRNGAIVAATIARELGGVDPAHAADYEARAKAFADEATRAYEADRAIAAALPVKDVFTYHSSWVYFTTAFGLRIVGTVEPLPGLPATAKHLAELVATARQRRVALLVQEPYFSDDAGRFLARETGLRVVKVAPSCDDATAGSYLAHIAAVLGQLAGAPAAPAPGR
jgi:zinc/manganese transport system substrate-binding protein